MKCGKIYVKGNACPHRSIIKLEIVKKSRIHAYYHHVDVYYAEGEAKWFESTYRNYFGKNV